MKQRKHRGNKKFIISFQSVHVTGSGKTRLSPRQSLPAEGRDAAQVLKGFLWGQPPETIIVTSVDLA